MSSLLSTEDLQLLTFLEDYREAGNTPPYKIVKLSKLYGRSIESSLNRLVKAGLVRLDRNNSISLVEPSLDRFSKEQTTSYERALAEIKQGRKTTHWIWYIFPQLRGLGSSPTSRYFSIRSKKEAISYLSDPKLGKRLKEANEELLRVKGKSARDILGYPDDMKLRSSATLFASVSPPNSVFHKVLDKYFEGRSDPTTLDLLKESDKKESI